MKKGEPKLDWMVSFKFPFNFRKVKLSVSHVSKDFLKQILKQFKMKS